MNRKTKWMMVLYMTAAVVLAACSGGGGGGAATTYSVGGAVAGLSGTVVLQNNGTDDLSVSANSPFTFATKIADGGTYNITVKTQPAAQICTASGNTGTIAGANVTNVSVACEGWTGTKQLGVAGKVTMALGIAVGPDNSVYAAGYTQGGLDGNTLAGTDDFIVSKYGPAGNRIYTKQTGTAGGGAWAYGVAVDLSGNVYVAGPTSGGLDGNVLAGTFDFFLTKYTPEGNKVFTRQTGTAGANAYAYGVAVDPSGNAYVAGYTDGGLDGHTLAGINDFFVTKYTTTGDKVYTIQTGTAGATTYGMSVAVDPNGNVYVAGSTTGGLDGNTVMGTTDCFVSKYTSTGNWVYTTQTGTAGVPTAAKGIAVDSFGNAYIAGYTDGSLDGNTLTGTEDAFVSKLTPTGLSVFTKQLGVSGKYSGARSVALDSSGNVYIAGNTNGGLDGNPPTGTADIFLAKYDSSGNYLYTRQLGVAGAITVVFGVAVDSSDNVYVTGYTQGGLDGNQLTGTTDFFIVKYDSAGNKQ